MQLIDAYEFLDDVTLFAKWTAVQTYPECGSEK